MKYHLQAMAIKHVNYILGKFISIKFINFLK